MTTTTPTTSANSKTHARALVRCNLAMREAQAILDRAQQELIEAETAAREAGFVEASVLWRSTRYQVTSGTVFKLSTTGTDEQLVEFARANGLKTTEPRPASCSASTLRAAYAKGLDVSSVASITETQVYTVGTH